MTTHYPILNRATGAVITTVEINCCESTPQDTKLGWAVFTAVRKGISLNWADLSGANLSGADLSGADLSGADLSGADLSGADLSGADLSRTNLYKADLSGANLSWANLYKADLSGANLSWANLNGVNLNGADLSRTNLCEASGIADRIIDGPLRSDGWRFRLTRTEPGPWRVKAGCRNLTLPEAREHWQCTRGDTALGDETFRILDWIEAEAIARGWSIYP